MKPLILTAAAALLLGSAAAIAQMHQHGAASEAPSKMKTMMQEKMKHHAGSHGGMHGGRHEDMSHSSGQNGSGHQADHGHAASAGPKGDTGPSSQAFHEANTRMHAGMDVTFTGNADVDFVSGMIPHHQGAVDMAKVVLAHGKDAEIRKLAEDIIRAQETEIAQMKAWLDRQRKP